MAKGPARGHQGAERRLAHLRSLEPRPPQGQGQEHRQGPGQGCAHARGAASVCWEVQSQGSDPRAFRLPPWAAGATGRGPKVSSAALRALGFGGQGHAVGRKGAARKSGAQVAALGRAHRKRRGGAAQHLSTLALGRDQAAPPARARRSLRGGRGGVSVPSGRCCGGSAPQTPGGPVEVGRPPRKKLARLAPAQSVPSLGVQPGRGEQAAEGRGSGRSAAQVCAPGRPPPRPARRYLKRPGRAVNRKLESSRGAAVALSPGRKRARRHPGSGSSQAPRTSPRIPPTRPREHKFAPPLSGLSPRQSGLRGNLREQEERVVFHTGRT
nr:5E5 antigen-like [Manis javanica]